MDLGFNKVTLATNEIGIRHASIAYIVPHQLKALLRVIII